MPAVPSFLLIVGSLLLVLWRATGRRTGRSVEAAIAGLALLAGLLLGRSIPLRLNFVLWPPAISPSGSMELALTPWSWAILASVLSFGLYRSLTSAPGQSPRRTEAQPASLVFIAAISLAAVAASLLTLVVTWTFVIAAQAWLASTSLADEEAGPAWGLVQGKDFASLLLVIAAFGFNGTGEIGGLPALLLLGLGGFLRVWSAVGTTTRGDGWVATLGFPTAASVLAALAWGWTAAIGEMPAFWLAAVGIILLLGGWLSGWLAETIDLRARGWIAGVIGMALLAAAAAPAQVEASLATAAAVLILAGTLGLAPSQGRIGARIGAAVAGLTIVGLPGLVGAVFFGAFAPRGGDSALAWLAVIGAGLLTSLLLADVVRRTAAPALLPAIPFASVASAVMVVLSVTLYLRLRPLVPPPVVAAAPAALLTAIAGAVLWGRVPEGRRSRIARALRWPVNLASPVRAAAAAGPIEVFVRGARDVFEGDASLLWALVFVVVGLLLLQGAV